MSTIASLNAVLRWDLDDFDRGTAHVEGVFGRLRSMIGGVADAFVAAGNRMTLGITLPLAGLATFTVKAASDAEELQSAFDFTFGEMAGRMNDWAIATGDAMGRSTQEMQKGALALGTLFNAAAPTRAAAAELSQSFAELAQDAASFFNEPSFESALERIRSGLTGEAEPLRKFGVFLTAAKVETKALELGLIRLGEELSEEGKIMARAAVIAEELAVAKGDVLRTSDSFANRTRALRAAIHELSVEMGERLMPIAERIVDWLQRAVRWFDRLPEGMKDALVKFALFAAIMGPVLTIMTKLAMVALPLLLVNLGPVAVAVSFIISPLSTLIVLLGKAFVQFGGIGAVLSRVGSLLVRFLGPVGAVITILLLFKDTIIDALGNVWDYAKRSLGPEIQGLFSAMAERGRSLLAAWDALAQTKLGQGLAELLGIVQTLAGYLIEFFGTAVVVAIEVVLDALTWLVKVGTNVINTITALINRDWAGAWFHIGKIAGDTMMTIADWIDWIFPKLAAFLRLKAAAFGSGDDTVPAAGGEAPGDRPAPGGGDRDYAVPGSGTKKGARGRGRSGPTAEELAQRREEIRLEQQLAVARAAGDIEAVRALERQRDLLDRIDQYRRAGLDKAQAQLAAEKDMLELDEARAKARAVEIADFERSIDMQLAEIRGDYEQLRILEDEDFLRQRILKYRQQEYDLAEAERKARQDLLHLDEARADAAAKRLRDAELAHQIELARLRGDNAEAGRLEEEDRIRQRVDELRRDGVSEDDALEEAMREASDRSRAHVQGNFRDAFRQGLRAALDGDLKGFFKNWLQDASFSALSKVLDRLADSLADLVFSGGKGSGGGFLGSLIGGLGKIFGGTGAGGGSSSARGSGKPGFNTGGSFRIRGFSGIDQNLLSLNGNPIARVSSGEIMDIRQGDQGGRNGVLTVRLEKDGGLTAHMEGIAGRVVGEAAPGIAAAGGEMAMGRFRKMRERSLVRG